MWGPELLTPTIEGKSVLVLFNFSDEEFCINMGDRIAQIIFEKIKTPNVKENERIGRY